MYVSVFVFECKSEMNKDRISCFALLVACCLELQNPTTDSGSIPRTKGVLFQEGNGE